MRKMIVLMAAVAAMAATAAPGAAVSTEKCTTSSRTVDDPSYSGPFPDNWKFTVTTCVRRSGADVVHRATVRWEVPFAASDKIWRRDYFYYNDTDLRVTGGRPGGGPVKTASRDLAVPLNKQRDGSVGVEVRGRYPKGKAVTGAVVTLDWRNDGKGPYRLKFGASPAV